MFLSVVILGGFTTETHAMAHSIAADTLPLLTPRQGTHPVLLQTGAVLGTDGCSPVMASLWQIHESGSSVARSRGSRVSRWGGPGLVGGIDLVVVARPHGGTSQFSRVVELST